MAGSRYFFSSYQCGSKIIIFGGLQSGLYAEGIAKVLETEQDEAQQLIKNQKKSTLQNIALKVKKDYIEKKKLSFKNVNGEFNSVDFEDDD